MLGEGRISLKVMTEVSELSTDNQLTLTQSVGINETTTLTIPSIRTRRAETTVEIPSGGALAMAGMIQEQTKQQINGIPGLMQLPVLGQLFRSRDFVNRQTELVVIVTPYVVRAVAQRNLSRPDDGFADASDPETICSAGSTASTACRSRRTRSSSKAPTVATMASFSTETPQRGGPDMNSNPSHVARRARRRRAADARARHGGRDPRRLLHRAARPCSKSIPNDYRQRHPIVLKEAPRTVELFIGNRRGNLTAAQRADVLAFAQSLAARGDRRHPHRRAVRHAQ